MKILTLIYLVAFAESKFTHRTNAFVSESVECVVSEAHGFTFPGWDDVNPQYLCTTDNDEDFLLEGDISALLGDSLESGHTQLRIPRDTVPANKIVNLNESTGIKVNNDRKRRQLTQTGTKTVLVVRVTDNSGNAPSQSEAQMTNDVFDDENNLKVRYEDCSNNQLIFTPATDSSLNGGVITVNTSTDLATVDWRTCGDIATGAVTSIARDFILIICPDVVDFEGAAAWGNRPGNKSWYRSAYASAPIVQMHEVGHNLGHGHSGKNGVTYADPTCNMGNQGYWSDTGSAFCFNAAKTWANGWYSGYHLTVDPTSTAHDGQLAGINAVVGSSIGANDKVVIKIDSTSETDLYMMFNRQTGALADIPDDGNEVVIVSQQFSLGSTSSWIAGLSQGQTYIQSNWAGSANSLVVEICTVDTSDPGYARVLIGIDGVNRLSCDASTAAPTASPVKSPTASPVKSPTASPNKSPTTSPVKSPTASPVKSPTASPIDSSTNAPTPSFNFCQDNKTKFFYKLPKINKNKKTCVFISRKIAKRCTFRARENCPVTCGTGCTCFDSPNTFKVNGKNRDCAWVGKNNNARRRCRNNRAYTNCPITCDAC